MFKSVRQTSYAAILLALSSVPASAPANAQQVLPPVLTAGAKSDVPVAVQLLRWHMLDGDVNSLMFRSMDTLFTTRSVPRSGAVWQLPREDHNLTFSYTFDGKVHPALDVLEDTYTNALLVMKDGKIVKEIYRNNTNASTRFIGFSMTKSLTSLLVGCALAEGRIKSLDDPITAYLPELKDGAYNGVTIRQIMEMRSGVDYEERYDFAHPGAAATNHINALVKNVARFADPARTIKRAHKPGTVWQYKTIDTAVLGWLIERVSGTTVAAYTAQKIWEPLGTERDGFYIMDGQPGVGREFSGAGFNATLRDWARLGLMMLNKGVANGKRIVSADWVSMTTTPVGKEDPEHGGYSYQWWTMGNSDAYLAEGLAGQYVYVDPDTKTVVVKLSYFPNQGWEHADAEAKAFFRAASAWKPN
ncbi:serine hydrolase domain-containing protein [Kordiimonas marina]|uniref:serine hydrolase domain-containing protein n=1 Tax=Kordiimonas marina TaxID=2872312 RepID=UPI001FF17AF7|nr:serine hydrolase [Kordiimonas marina]MCJ9427772.1 beta-lactamase family protein [Kordiimonas marina]